MRPDEPHRLRHHLPCQPRADVTAVDALSLAKKAGNIKSVNVVLIGVMARNSEIPYEKWVETIKTTVPAKFLDINLKAFDLGYKGED